MTELETALRRICADLARTESRFALVGGLAVSARAEPRFTRDADLAVAVASDAEAERLVRGLRAYGYRVEALVEQEAMGRLATVRLTGAVDSPGPVIDLLFASSGIEGEVVADAEPIELLPQLTLRVATTGHLLALKVLARDDQTRPQDLGDLRALLRRTAHRDYPCTNGAAVNRRSRIRPRPRSSGGIRAAGARAALIRSDVQLAPSDRHSSAATPASPSRIS